MTTIFAIHGTDPEKLQAVITEMRVLGAPTIEVVDCADHYMALEGSHRLAAARHLGLTPNLIIRDLDDLIDVTKYDWYEASNWAGTTYPAGEVARELFSPSQAVDYRFD